jgi:hypothetical protein
LQSKLLKAYFHNFELGGSGSFLEFYDKNIQKYVASPYRENCIANITITQGQSDKLIVIDQVYYVCKKNGGRIQNSVIWIPDVSQEIFYMKICAKRPAENSYITLFEKEEKLSEADLKDLMAGISLSSIGEQHHDLTSCDNLVIFTEQRYVLTGDAVTWYMVLPTKQVTITVSTEKKYDLDAELFMATPEAVYKVSTPGFLQINYSDWMLPHNGVVIRMIERNAPIQDNGLGQPNTAIKKTPAEIDGGLGKLAT